MIELPESALAVLASDALAHLVTINRDGSPQVSCVWVGVEDGEIVSGHLRTSLQKLRNVARDPRVTLSLETARINEYGLKEYLVVHGRARITEGGAAALLQELAHVYLGPEVVFPPMPDPPPGVVLRVAPERIGGIGPWSS
jgi:PPOX class probable F420-dependent enzyme